jgi:rhodanese-related sulfurtransferase
MTAATPVAPTIRPGALAQSEGAVGILDVRTPAEYETAHIPGSYNLPLDQLAPHAGALRAATGPLVVVCQQGIRARDADRLLRAAGCQAVQVLEGGVAAWEAAGLPLERGRERWSMERQVRGVAGGLVLAGALGGLFVARPLTALAAAIGGGLVFSALSNTCGMAKVLGLLPYNRGAGCDPAATIAALTAPGSSTPTGAAPDAARNGQS